MTALSELNVPGPTIIPLTEPLWTAAAKGRLSVQRCGSCDAHVFYPRGRCPYCWADALAWVEISGRGSLKSFSEVWKPGHSGWLPAVPYVVGLVALAEGPTMLSHILIDKNPVRVGDPLLLVPTNIGGRVLPCFAIDRN